MEEGARRATAADIPRLAELARQAIEELRPRRGGAVWAEHEARAEPIQARLEADLEASDHLLLAGTIDDCVVAYAGAHLEPLHRGGSIAVLTDLYVEPEAREVGVGELLLDAAIAWATEQGCAGIDSIALPGDRETKNFFESAGMVARAIVVHRSLP